MKISYKGTVNALLNKTYKRPKLDRAVAKPRRQVSGAFVVLLRARRTDKTHEVPINERIFLPDSVRRIKSLKPRWIWSAGLGL